MQRRAQATLPMTDTAGRNPGVAHGSGGKSIEKKHQVEKSPDNKGADKLDENEFTGISDENAGNSENENNVDSDIEEKNWREELLSLKYRTFLNILEASIIQEQLKVNFERDTRILRDTRRSRDFFISRYTKKGVPIDTWKLFTENPQIAVDLIYAEEEEDTVDNENDNGKKGEDKYALERSVSNRVKAIESFRKKIHVKGTLDPSLTYQEKFRRDVRRIQCQIHAHSQLLETDMEFGYLFFRSCLSSKARKRFDDYVELREQKSVRVLTPKEKLEVGIQHLCDEDNSRDMKRGFNEELAKLKREKFRYVDQINNKYTKLCNLFPSHDIDSDDRLNHYEALLKNHRFGKELLLAISEWDVQKMSSDELFRKLRIKEKIIHETRPRNTYTPQINVSGNNASGRDPSKKANVCFNFLKKGSCRFGDSCKYKHIQSEKVDRICKFYKRGNCKFGSRCKFKHIGGNQETNEIQTATGSTTGITSNVSSQGDGRPTTTSTQRTSSNDAKHSTTENDVTEMLGTNLPQINIASKPYTANESLRQRNVLRVFVEGVNGPSIMRALLDDGSQPTTISLQKVNSMAQLGVRMKRTKMNGQVRGLSTSCVQVDGEVEFEVRVKCKQANSGYVRFKVYAIVLNGNVNFDFILGQDMRNLYRIMSYPDPNPEKRKVTIDGTMVYSYPCTSHQSSNSLILDSNPVTLPGFTETNPRSTNLITKTKSLESCLVHETLDLLDAADSRLRECDHVYSEKIPDKEIKHRLGKIISLQQVHNESERSNSELASGDCLRMLNRVEKGFQTGKTLMTSREQFYYLRRVLCRYSSRFVENIPETGQLRMPPHEVHDYLLPDKKFIHQKPYRLPPDRLNAMEKKLEELEQHGLCYKVSNEEKVIATSPAFPVWDKGKDTCRVVISMKRVNDSVELMYFVMPITENTIRKVITKKWVISTDAKSGWPQIGCTKKTQMTFVFVTQKCARSSKGLPFGYKNAPQIFAWLMVQIVKGLNDTVVHVDDYYNMGDTFMAALLEFTRFMQRAESKNLYLSAKKLQAFPRELSLVGIIRKDGKHYPDPKRMYPLDALQPPKKGVRFLKTVQRIIGLFIYYLRYVKDFWQVIRPISILNSKTAPQIWGKEQQMALDAARDMLKSAALFTPKFEKTSRESPFLVDVDASKYAGGATLSQVIEGVERLICCFSFTWRKHQIKWHVIRKEFDNGARSLDHFSIFIKGFPTKVRMDAKVAIHMVAHGQDKLREPYTRISVAYNSYMITEVEYRDGPSHKNADCISRPGQDIENDSDKETLTNLFPLHHASAMLKYFGDKLDNTICLSCNEPAIGFHPKDKSVKLTCSQLCYDLAKRVGFDETKFRIPTLSTKSNSKLKVKCQQKSDAGTRVGKALDVKCNIAQFDYDSMAHPCSTLAHEADECIENQCNAVEYVLEFLEMQANNLEIELKSDILSEQLPEEQKAEFKKIFQALENKRNPNHALTTSQYKIINGVLHKYGDYENEEEGVPLLIVVPKSYRRKIMDTYHITNLANHRHGNDMAAKILQVYYWPGLKYSCKKYVATCQVCIRTKSRLKQLPYKQLQIRGVMEAISIDAIGRIEGKYHYILNACILSIGYIFAKCYKKLNAKVMSEFLFDFIVIFGVPKKILTDQGPEFMNSVMLHLRNRLGFLKLTTSSKSKTGNSLIERKNRVVNNGILAQLTQLAESRYNWHKELPYAVFSANTLLPNSRGNSYAKLLFGFQPKLEGDLEEKRLPVRDERVADEIDARILTIKKMRQLFMTERSEWRFERNFKRNDKLGQLKSYRIGDMVWLLRQEDRKGHRVRPHFAVKKTGPLVITAKNRSSNTYRVEDPQTNYRNVVHAKYLSPFGTFTPLPVHEEEAHAAGDMDEDGGPDESESEDSEEGTYEEDDADVSARNILMSSRQRRVPDRGVFVTH